MNESTEKSGITVVIPVYRGMAFLGQLTHRVKAAVDETGLPLELILVDDSCPENSWETIKNLCLKHPWVRGIKLSRNFGQHNAITAGLAAKSYEWTVIMDCDLQDRPEEIPQLYLKAKEGYDLVRALRVNRNDHFIKRLSSSLFNRLFSYLTGTHKNPQIANFGIYHKSVVEAVLSLGDHIRFTPSLMEWVGFKEAQIPVKHDARQGGQTSYSWMKLLSLALDNVVAFSLKPLHLTIRLGFLISLTAVGMSAFYFYQYFNNQIEVRGYASLIISIWFLSGVIVSVLGIVGLYVGYAFMNTKQRPTYIIHETA